MSTKTKSPSFISALKQKAEPPARKNYSFKPRQEVLEKLHEIVDAEDLSATKLIEYAIEAIYEKWAAERGKAKAKAS